MAHNVETMAYSGETPWHGLGTKVPHDLSTQDMLKEAKLDWEVKKYETTVGDYEKDMYEKTGSYALVRDYSKYAKEGESKYNVLAPSVGKGWCPVQNHQALDFFQDYVLKGDMEMHTAGSLNSGKIVWALAKVKCSFNVFNKKDRVEAYMLFTNPHMHGKCIDIRLTPIRVVCNNTLTWALESKSSNSIRINHRKPFDASVVQEHMGMVNNAMSDYHQLAQYLSKTKYTTEALVSYLNEVYPSKRLGVEKSYLSKKPVTDNAKQCFDLVETSPGSEYFGGTWWNVLNAVTYNTDHCQGKTRDGRLTSAWYGRNADVKARAVKLIEDYAY